MSSNLIALSLTPANLFLHYAAVTLAPRKQQDGHRGAIIWLIDLAESIKSTQVSAAAICEKFGFIVQEVHRKIIKPGICSLRQASKYKFNELLQYQEREVQ